MHTDVHAYAVVWTYFIVFHICRALSLHSLHGIRKASRLAASSPVSTENTSSNAVFACSSHLILKLPAVEMRCLVQHLVALLKVTSFTGWLNVWTIETDMLGEDVINQTTPAAKTSGFVNPLAFRQNLGMLSSLRKWCFLKHQLKHSSDDAHANCFALQF